MANNRRDEFLIHMYDQMFNDINRHIMVVWQSIGLVIGAFAIFALAEKEIVPVDFAVALILLISGWSLSHLEDASYWYNRNLAIIGNIERAFLEKQDLHDIHYYFGKHRPDNKMIGHLKIQYALGVSIIIVVLLFHFNTRVVPGFDLPKTAFDPMKALPYAVTVGNVIYLLWFRKNRKRSYLEFIQNSPGKSVDTTDMNYGPGHGFQ